MRLKVDEHLPRAACDLLSRAGHDATSVGEQGPGGADDARLDQLCQDERRALITLVLDAVASALRVLEGEPLDKRLLDRRGGSGQDPRVG